MNCNLHYFLRILLNFIIVELEIKDFKLFYNDNSINLIFLMRHFFFLGIVINCDKYFIYIITKKIQEFFETICYLYFFIG